MFSEKAGETFGHKSKKFLRFFSYLPKMCDMNKVTVVLTGYSLYNFYIEQHRTISWIGLE